MRHVACADAAGGGGGGVGFFRAATKEYQSALQGVSRQFATSVPGGEGVRGVPRAINNLHSPKNIYIYVYIHELTENYEALRN